MQRVHLGKYLALTIVLAVISCLPELRKEGALEYSAESRAVMSDRQWLADQIDQAGLELQVAPPPKPEMEGWRPLFSFVHVADVQLRDAAIKYFSNGAEAGMADVFATSIQRHPKLDQNDEYPWAALVGGINGHLKTVGCDRENFVSKPECPRFLIHGGDAIDSGTLGELYRFLSIANRLQLPWYSVVGNHDINLMGNFSESTIRFKNVATEGVPLVLSRSRFMRYHGATRWNSTMLHEPTREGWFGMPASRFHGFDTLLPRVMLPDEDIPLRSYYSLRFSTQAQNGNSPEHTIRFRIIVLDTTEQHRMIRRMAGRETPIVGALGYVEPEQYDWLKSEIADAEAKREVILLVGHHPLLAPPDLGSKLEQLGDLLGTDPSGTRDIAVKTLFREHPSMKAYFGGHTHVLRLKEIPNSHAVEVTAPSLHELPQVAFLVSFYLGSDARKLGMLVQPIQGVAGRNDQLAERLKLSCEGALLDKKKKVPHTGPSCGLSWSRFYELGDLPQQSPPDQSGALPNPAPEPQYRRLVDLQESIQLPWSELGHVTLSKLLAVLKKRFDAVNIWLSVELLGSTDQIVYVGDFPRGQISIDRLLDLLTPRIKGPTGEYDVTWRYEPVNASFVLFQKPSLNSATVRVQPVCVAYHKLKFMPVGQASSLSLRWLLGYLQSQVPCVRLSMTLDVLDWLDGSLPVDFFPSESVSVREYLCKLLPRIPPPAKGKGTHSKLDLRIVGSEVEHYQLFVSKTDAGVTSSATASSCPPPP